MSFQELLPDPVCAVIDAAIERIYALGPTLEPTLILVPAVVRDKVLDLSETIGFDVETLNFTLGLFLCYPLAMIMTSLPYGNIRHIFSFLLGAFLMQFTIGVQWMHHVVCSLVAYALLAVLPRKMATMVVPAFAMLYLVFGHLHRQYVNYLGYDLDFTGSQMVLTQKLYMLAFNLYDGELLSQKKETRAAKKCQEFAVYKLPSLIEYLGYVFCFSNVLAGPAYEFSLYEQGCTGTHLYDAKTGQPKGKIPSNVWPSVRPLLLCLVCLATFVVGGGYFPLLDPNDPQVSTPIIINDEKLQGPWINRYAYMWLALFFVRQKYYFAWKSAEGANNIWYAGFEGFDEKGEPKGWENSNNMDILEFETAPNLSTLSRSWNKKVSNWLARYIYMRTGGSLVATYGMSAFWHGFYPGYYLFFMSVPLLTFCERLGRKKISPHFEGSVVYGLVCRAVTSLFVEYLVIPFQLLALSWSWTCWKSHYFFGHIVAVVFLIVMSNVPTPKKKEKAL